METRAQALRKSAIPAKAGIQGPLIEVDSRFLPAFARMTGNDGLKETIYLSFVRNQEGRSSWQARSLPDHAQARASSQ